MWFPGQNKKLGILPLAGSRRLRQLVDRDSHAPLPLDLDPQILLQSQILQSHSARIVQGETIAQTWDGNHQGRTVDSQFFDSGRARAAGVGEFDLGVGGGAGSTDPVRVFWGQNVFHTAIPGDTDRAGSAEVRVFTVGRRKDYGEWGVNEKPHHSTRVTLVTRTAEVDLPDDENGMFSLPW